MTPKIELVSLVACIIVNFYYARKKADGWKPFHIASGVLAAALVLKQLFS